MKNMSSESENHVSLIYIFHMHRLCYKLMVGNSAICVFAAA